MSLYYRNIQDVISIEGSEIDAGSLWKLDVSQNLLILEDEDQYVTHVKTDDFDLVGSR